jgi:N-acetylglucosamine PTS system EIIB component
MSRTTHSCQPLSQVEFGNTSPQHHADDHRRTTSAPLATITATITGSPAGKGANMSKADDILAGLGGAANIIEVEGCITRLRTEVKDPSLVDDAALKRCGAHGVVRAGTVVQVVVGPEADGLADDIQDLL